jgi:uncharacterized protein YcbX
VGTVAALYRYPVKGFTPESRESLTVVDGRVAGDRVLGFRFANTPEPNEAWSSKHGMLALVNTPGITRLRLSYDEATQRLGISLDGELLVEDRLDAAGRARICGAVANFVKDLPESGLKGHPERLPLRLVGDGHTSRYQDQPDGYVTIHGRASVQALGKALNDPDLSELRFRSNVSVDGLEPFEEQGWIGKTVRVGSMQFRVHTSIGRCLAPHANPETGQRDRPILTTLTHAFGQEKPTLAVGLVPEGAGNIAIGDEVLLEG